MSTVAMYYFQGDLGESQEYPNAFVVSLIETVISFRNPLSVDIL